MLLHPTNGGTCILEIYSAAHIASQLQIKALAEFLIHIKVFFFAKNVKGKNVYLRQMNITIAVAHSTQIFGLLLMVTS